MREASRQSMVFQSTRPEAPSHVLRLAPERTSRTVREARPRTWFLSPSADEGTLREDDQDMRVADEVWSSSHGPAKPFPRGVTSSRAPFIVLEGPGGCAGVLALYPDPRDLPRLPLGRMRHLTDVWASLIASALDRIRLAEEARRARVEIETGRIRKRSPQFHLPRSADASTAALTDMERGSRSVRSNRVRRRS